MSFAENRHLASIKTTNPVASLSSVLEAYISNSIYLVQWVQRFHLVCTICHVLGYALILVSIVSTYPKAGFGGAAWGLMMAHL